MKKTFTYRKANGEEKERTVFVIAEPSASYHTIDLTNISKARLPEVLDQLQMAKLRLQEVITGLGLSDKYRNFRQDRILRDV